MLFLVLKERLFVEVPFTNGHLGSQLEPIQKPSSLTRPQPSWTLPKGTLPNVDSSSFTLPLGPQAFGDMVPASRAPGSPGHSAAGAPPRCSLRPASWAAGYLLGGNFRQGS